MDLAKFTTIAQRRIEAGLLEINSRPSAAGEHWHTRLLNDMHSAYDLFAEELLPGRCDPDNPRVQSVLKDEIPQLVSDVVIEYQWLPYHTIGRFAIGEDANKKAGQHTPSASAERNSD